MVKFHLKREINFEKSAKLIARSLNREVFLIDRHMAGIKLTEVMKIDEKFRDRNTYLFVFWILFDI